MRVITLATNNIPSSIACMSELQFLVGLLPLTKKSKAGKSLESRIGDLNEMRN